MAHLPVSSPILPRARRPQELHRREPGMTATSVSLRTECLPDGPPFCTRLGRQVHGAVSICGAFLIFPWLTRLILPSLPVGNKQEDVPRLILALKGTKVKPIVIYAHRTGPPFGHGLDVLVLTPSMAQGLGNFSDTASLFDECLRGQVPEGTERSIFVVMVLHS